MMICQFARKPCTVFSRSQSCALDLYTITGRMMKQNLKYYSAPRDSDRDNNMSIRSEAMYSLLPFSILRSGSLHYYRRNDEAKSEAPSYPDRDHDM